MAGLAQALEWPCPELHHVASVGLYVVADVGCCDLATGSTEAAKGLVS
jgi:hypothetical protein